MDELSNSVTVSQVTLLKQENNATQSEISTTHTHTNPISQSQNQNINTSQLSANTNSSFRNQDDLTNNTPTLSTDPILNHTVDTDFTLVHHDAIINYVLNKYCQPVNQALKYPDNDCNFKKNCIVHKTKVLRSGTVLPNISPTVFSHVSLPSRKHNYNILDARLIKCFNPSCKTSQTKEPKLFHYICYKHMRKVKKNESMKDLQIEKENDKLLDLIEKSVDMESIQTQLLSTLTKLIFPVCGKRCYNTVSHYRVTKNKSKGDTEYTIAKSWDTDGTLEKNDVRAIAKRALVHQDFKEFEKRAEAEIEIDNLLLATPPKFQSYLRHWQRMSITFGKFFELSSIVEKPLAYE